MGPVIVRRRPVTRTRSKVPGMPKPREHVDRGLPAEPSDVEQHAPDEPLLPVHNHHVPQYPRILPARINQMAIQLKILVERMIPVEIKPGILDKPNCPLFTPEVISLVDLCCPGDEKCAVVYCLLLAMEWFKQEGGEELTEADISNLRAKCCQVLAKWLLDIEEDDDYMMQGMLLRKFRHRRGKNVTSLSNAVERAVDLHALTLISSGGYQKCINYLWRGWIIQDPDDGTQFVPYMHVADPSWSKHFDHDRLRAPRYQNYFQIFVSIVFLVLYTIVINTLNPGGELDVIEGFLYFFTLAYTFDECGKIFKVGWDFLSFWSGFNFTLYALIITSFVFRMTALAWDKGTPQRYDNQVLSYNFLAFAAPMVWMRMLLYLDGFQFFGTMLLVLKMMMRESLIFFSLLLVVLVGFLQAFIGLDGSDNKADATNFIIRSMIGAVLGGPDLASFDSFAHPFGMILYHLFTFIVIVILLNILIALYNQAYTDIMENAEEEFLCLYAHKTMRFVRAPDENVFLPPFNVIEIFCLIIPLEWWMSRKHYAYLNDKVMRVIYSPLMVLIAFWEVRLAQKVLANRLRGDSDDDRVMDWETVNTTESDVFNNWYAACAVAGPAPELNPAHQTTKEILKLRDELTSKLEELDRRIGSVVATRTGSGEGASGSSDSDG